MFNDREIYPICKGYVITSYSIHYTKLYETAKALEEADVIEESMNNSDDVPPYTEEDFAGIGDEPAEDDWDDDLPF